MIPKIEVSWLGNYTRNVGYKTDSIIYDYETKTLNYNRGIRLLADVMDVEDAVVLDCFVVAGSELQRTQVAPEGWVDAPPDAAWDEPAMRAARGAGRFNLNLNACFIRNEKG